MSLLPETTASMEITQTTVIIEKPSHISYEQEEAEFKSKFGSVQKKNNLLKQSNKAKKFDSADYYLQVQKIKK